VPTTNTRSTAEHVRPAPHRTSYNGIRRIFGYQRSESVKALIRGLGRVNVKLNITKKCIQNLIFCIRLFVDLVDSTKDSGCNTVFLSLSTAINNIFLDSLVST